MPGVQHRDRHAPVTFAAPGRGEPGGSPAAPSGEAAPRSAHLPSARDAAAPEQPFQHALRQAIAHRHLTLERLQRLLADEGVTLGTSTLSAWQSGRRQPSGPEALSAASALERVLRLRPGHLTALLEDVLTSTTPSTRLSRLISGRAQRIDELFAEVGCPDMDSTFSLRASTTRLQMAPNGGVAQVELEVVLRARRTASRFAVLVGFDEGADIEQVTPRQLAGGRLGRVVRDAECECVVSEVVLSSTVRRGDLIHLRQRVTNEAPVPASHSVRYVGAQQPISLLEVQFHPECPPVEVVEFTRRTADGPDVQWCPVAIPPDLRLTSIQEAGRRRASGLRWSYA